MSNLIPKIIGQVVNVVGHISPSAAVKLSIFLFSRPRKGQLKTTANSVLEEAITKRLTYDQDIIMTYQWSGSNKRILLAHGWESNSARWEALVKYLRSGDHDIIALDAPAHGLSGGHSFNALLYSKFIEVTINEFQPDVVIGHSVGGMASVFSKSVINESSVSKMILLGAPDKFTDVLQRYVDMMGYNKNIHYHINKWINVRYGKTPDYYSTASFSQKISIPQLIIHDENDTVIPFQDAKSISESSPYANLISTTGLGHGLKGKFVYDCISDFIKS